MGRSFYLLGQFILQLAAQFVNKVSHRFDAFLFYHNYAKIINMKVQNPEQVAMTQRKIDRLHFSRRALQYFIRTLIAVLLVGGVCVLAFTVASRLSSTYILVHEGMALRSDYILGKADYNELAGYFTEESLAQDARLRDDTYSNFTITDWDYTLTIEKVRVHPWYANPHIIVIEQVKGIRGTVGGDMEGILAPPPFTTLRYRVSLGAQDGRWYIIGLTVLEIDPEIPPAATPDPDMEPVPMATAKPTAEPLG